jgi:hypothetical protein
VVAAAGQCLLIGSVSVTIHLSQAHGPWDEKCHMELKVSYILVSEFVLQKKTLSFNLYLHLSSLLIILKSLRIRIRLQLRVERLSSSTEQTYFKMRFTVLITSIIIGLATAMPDPTPQGYSGPCDVSNCGATGAKCRSGALCVGWPNTDPALRKGCTCSNA